MKSPEVRRSSGLCQPRLIHRYAKHQVSHVEMHSACVAGWSCRFWYKSASAALSHPHPHLHGGPSWVGEKVLICLPALWCGRAPALRSHTVNKQAITSPLCIYISVIPLSTCSSPLCLKSGEVSMTRSASECQPFENIWKKSLSFEAFARQLCPPSLATTSCWRCCLDSLCFSRLFYPHVYDIWLLLPPPSLVVFFSPLFCNQYTCLDFIRPTRMVWMLQH